MDVDARDLDKTRTAIAEAVLAQVQGALPAGIVSEITLDTPLDELGLDSIAIMEVFSRIEQAFGMRFREEWLYDMQTCRQVVDCVAAHMNPNSRPDARPVPPLAADPVARRIDGPQIAASAETPAEIPAEHYDVAAFPECVMFHERLATAAAAGLANPFFRLNEHVRAPRTIIQGREAISYTSFDYLGLASDPRVGAAAKEAIDRFGTSASASRLVGGDNLILKELDCAVAEFLGTESAIVFPSGYGTNASLFGHLFGEQDLILYDELAHNSIVHGALGSKAGRRSFRHNDFGFLDSLLRDLRGQYRRVVVAVEGVYSMDGDYPDLPHLVEVKNRHRALLYVDEAHSLGVMGRTGRGICEHFGVNPAEGDLWMGTISKALASGGGYLAGREKLISYLKYTTPSFVFATACSPANTAASLAALHILQAEPQRVARLRDRSALFLKLARERGFDTGNSHDTPVIPIILGDSKQCIRVSQKLLLRGVHAQPILYPAVRESAARVRFFITAEHTEEQIQRTIEVLSRCVESTKE